MREETDMGPLADVNETAPPFPAVADPPWMKPVVASIGESTLTASAAVIFMLPPLPPLRRLPPGLNSPPFAATEDRAPFEAMRSPALRIVRAICPPLPGFESTKLNAPLPFAEITGIRGPTLLKESTVITKLSGVTPLWSVASG